MNSVGLVTQTYTYDANGNALTDSYRGISGSTYDIHNLPFSQTHTNGAISHWYDANGNRVRKQQGGTDHYYVTGAEGETEAVYTWNGSLRFWNIVAGGQLIGKIVPGPTRYYYLKDHLGSIRVTVKEDNTIAGWDDYYPFGMVMAGRSGNSGQGDTKYKFTEKERDVETGYDYFGARYYDSRSGRWMSVDPLAAKFAQWSPYVYVRNNPLLRFDPDGKQDKVAQARLRLRDMESTARTLGPVIDRALSVPSRAIQAAGGSTANALATGLGIAGSTLSAIPQTRNAGQLLLRASAVAGAAAATQQAIETIQNPSFENVLRTTGDAMLMVGGSAATRAVGAAADMTKVDIDILQGVIQAGEAMSSTLLDGIIDQSTQDNSRGQGSSETENNQSSAAKERQEPPKKKTEEDQSQ